MIHGSGSITYLTVSGFSFAIGQLGVPEIDALDLGSLALQPVAARQALQQENIRFSDCKPPKTTVASPWYDVLTERERLVLGHMMLTRPAATSVDTSQSLGRAMKGQELLPTLTPGMHLWLLHPFGKDGAPLNRILTGLESLYLHGWPKRFLKTDIMAQLHMSDNLLRDLCGNSFDGHAPCLVETGKPRSVYRFDGAVLLRPRYAFRNFPKAASFGVFCFSQLSKHIVLWDALLH